ncbi:16S rRNA (guanine(527)-N(7))-methyltransferase RsmG [Leadbetterella byssophila]|uniref:Ribosomal RNA small subunit methyltransferase G n=1 Tax=Leadbetterella byssophila (strain DSM 17132 / JCM 16389 / KACC 11308 / NBRC 106382 / 4M15) TaxID=649349 RepID=E4RRU2_LEAB4|nr:16S rRNA m(7)G-527 methyltransferase [Leadbetterella byssophila DSM 17132]
MFKIQKYGNSTDSAKARIFVKNNGKVKADIIYKYFPELTEEQKDQFERLEDLYKEWNAQINVISRKDIDSLYERHVLHSLGIAKVCTFAPDSDVLDVGTGGGFPGIPLAILFPEVNFHLVDAVGKKIKVVQEVANGLGLKNVKAEHERVEKLRDTYDFVISRAVTRMEPFIGWVRNKFNRNHFSSLDNGILYLKGGDLNEELKEIKRKYKVYPLQDFFEEEFFETKKVVYVPF